MKYLKMKECQRIEAIALLNKDKGNYLFVCNRLLSVVKKVYDILINHVKKITDEIIAIIRVALRQGKFV